MKTDEFEHLWKDSRNWPGKMVYFCKEDPRCIVPKRSPWMGKTLNFAHRTSYLILIITILLLATVPIAIQTGALSDSITWVVTELFLLIGTLIFFYRADIRVR